MSKDHRLMRLASGMLGEAAGCPPADRIQEFVEGLLEAHEARGVSEHVSLCDGCSEAIRYMEGESSSPAGSAGPPLPKGVQERSEQVIQQIAGGIHHLPGLWQHSFMRLAAGIVLVGSLSLLGWLGMGGRFFDGDPGSFRSAQLLEPVAPEGEVTAAEVSFEWVGHPQAESYRVILFNAGMERIWEGVTPGAEPSLSPEPGTFVILEPGAWHTWQVVALGKIGEEIDRSPAGHFRVAGLSSD